MRSFDRTALTTAGLGSLLTLPLLAVTWGLHLALASLIVREGWGVDLRVDKWAVPAFRRASSIAHLYVGVLLLFHWGIVALLGRGDVLRVRSANTLLFIFASFWTAHMLVVCLGMNAAAPAQALCPWFGVGEEPVEFGLDVPTLCESFARDTYDHIFFSLPLLLLAASAVLRVIVNRRRARV